MKLPFKQPKSLIGRIFFWGVPSVFLILVVGFLWMRAWLGSYLESEAFREWLAHLTSKQLQARCEYEPFHFAGLSVKADALKAQGTDKAAFSTLELDKLSTAINLSGLWSKSLEIDNVAIDRIRISLGHTGAPPVPESEIGTEPTVQKTAESHPSWFSPTLDLRRVVVNETDVIWGENTPQEGSMQKTEVTVTPNGDAWNIVLQGGTISQHGEPDFKLDHVKVHYQDPMVDISEGVLQFPQGGDIGITGQVNTKKNLEVHVKVNSVPVKPFLPPDQQSHLEGTLFADVTVAGPIPVEDSLSVSGDVHLENANVEGIQLLDFFAKLLRAPGFSKIKLDVASAHFNYTAQKVTITNLIVEKKGLLCVKGKISIVNSRAEGDLEVGIPHEAIQLIPPLETEVFTGSGDGYRWYHYEGPLSNFQEALVKRIATAAPQAVLGLATDVLKQVPKIPDDPKKAVQSLFDKLHK
ncbi:MAG TPA: hypothetical protein VG733_16475 [Chthoniobacteraceae bacterium]|nr:hypothetical protein [Chthoniobacteraceae bacterium]